MSNRFMKKNRLFAIILSPLVSVALQGCVNGSAAGTASEQPATDISATGSPVCPYIPYTEMKKLWAAPSHRAPLISEYDHIIRALSRKEGYDWRLIAAIADTESKFDKNIVSGAGARGLMQIMPIVARHFGVPEAEIADPRTNIWLGIEHLNYIEAKLRLSPSAPFEDRISIILAAYNCGLGHVCDARSLARSEGMNPDSWPQVARYLKLKFNPEYYMDSSVRFGQFEDSEQTLSFVDKVLRSYDSYCRDIPM